ncbi:MAG: CRISPR-associated endonuclease Cas6 [Clostridiales bacterium]
MELHVLEFKMEGINIKSSDIPKLRGYIANKFPEYLELHNHIDKSKYNYGYPLIQYKSINKIPYIIAISNAALIIYEIMPEIQSIKIKDKILKIYEKGVKVDRKLFGHSNNMIEYEFKNPWLPLNQKNYIEYKEYCDKDRTELLRNIMIGNILSMSKSFNYWFDKKLEIKLNIKPIRVNFKNNEMTAFKGNFIVNFNIPDYFGIGKSVSRGFGTIKKKSEWD